jgi:hypothetical protein
MSLVGHPLLLRTRLGLTARKSFIGCLKIYTTSIAGSDSTAVERRISPKQLIQLLQNRKQQ